MTCQFEQRVSLIVSYLSQTTRGRDLHMYRRCGADILQEHSLFRSGFPFGFEIAKVSVVESAFSRDPLGGVVF